MIHPLLNAITQRLQTVSESAALDAQVLLAAVLGRKRAWVLAHPEARLTPDQEAELEAKLERLSRGEPLPYVLGHWEFYGLDLEVSPEALIPRPETELLVDYALRWLAAHPSRRWVADVGTGTGCVAIALAYHASQIQVIAGDCSWPALSLARRNIRRYGLERRISLVQADLLTPFDRSFDVICANLPYIPSALLDELPVARWEPRLALDGGPDGLEPLRRLLAQAPRLLQPGGLLLVEIGADQGAAALALVQAAFPSGQATLHPDLAGHPRFIAVQEA